MTRDEQWLLNEKYGDDASAAGFAADRARIKKGEPLAYVIGWQPFLNLAIHLDSHPLIPRVETEWWMEKLLSEAGEAGLVVRLGQAARSAAKPASPAEPSMRFLDLCAGSGAIGCAALARLPDARVYFGEIDPAHEPTIRKNIHENHLDASRADVRIGDLFEPFGDMRFDVIATNPPYIPSSRVLPESVSGYEPEEALYAGDDGLAVVRRIAEALPRHLAPCGQAWVEIDSEHAQAAADLFRARDFSVEIRTDQYGRDRVLVVSFP